MTTFENDIMTARSQTTAIIDGQKYLINVAYETITPLVRHTADCDIKTKKSLYNNDGIRVTCSCGATEAAMSKIEDKDTLIVAARASGKIGKAKIKDEYPAYKPASSPKTANRPCPKCGTYCDGDCEA